MKKLAIITGASRGIGKAAAQKFISEGWDVFNLARNGCDVAGVKNYACDLLDTQQIISTVASLDMEAYQKIALVHNAALLKKDNYATLDEKNFKEVMQVNVFAPQTISRLLANRLPAGSAIIFIGSTLSEIAAPNLLSYVSSKHALAGLMKSTCLDMAGKNVHSCIIAPGFTDTQMLRESVGTDTGVMDAIKAMVIMGRLASPEEIAGLIYFAANNPVINGAVLHANLGQK